MHRGSTIRRIIAHLLISYNIKQQDMPITIFHTKIIYPVNSKTFHDVIQLDLSRYRLANILDGS